MTKRKMVLTMAKDAKTVKGLKLGYLTGILYLAPHTLGGKNICPNSENAGCQAACLYSAGRGGFNSVQKARLAKTDRFHNDTQAFLSDLKWSVAATIRKAERLGLTPCIRLNGTSDIDWQSILIDGKTIFDHYPTIQFYDYSKIPKSSEFDNYHITFSYSEASKKYTKSIIKALDLGLNIAVVFSSANLPEHFLGHKVVNGDDSDLRFLDEPKRVIALIAKGKAKKDLTGFVVHNTLSIPAFNI